MIKEYSKTVMSVRNKNGSKSSQIESKKDVSDTKNYLSKLSSTLTEMKSRIGAFSDKPQSTSSSESNSDQETPISGEAGNSFGGRDYKRTKT